MNSTTSDKTTNGSGGGRADPGDGADIFANLEALRLTPDEAGQIGSEEVLALSRCASRTSMNLSG
jgi:hypothetical protein